MEAKQSATTPHVLIFPFPAQGHVNSMLKLAELLGIAGLNVTFLNSEYNHDRLFQHTDIKARFAPYAGIQFRSIPDGLPDDHPRSGDRIMELFGSLTSVSKAIFKDMLPGIRPRVTCAIGDGVPLFVGEIVSEFGIPMIHFRTLSACCVWAYLSMPQVIEAGQLPVKENEDMDRLITKVPGMENFLRYRDLPSFCRDNFMEDPTLKMVVGGTQLSAQAYGLILNTFEDLESPILSHIRTKCRNIYPIGPIHQLLKTKRNMGSQDSLQSSNSIWKVDRTCMEWLDRQPSKSVLYVSFGSITLLTRDQFMEFWYGIVNSKKRFLWVVRPESIDKDSHKIPVELEKGTKERGCIVEWAPQEEVLAHKAIGGFLTHSGWNSTLESIVTGVPMICWPYFADQQLNSRFVGEVWKLGLDMKDVCDRKIIEKMVNDLMVERREEFLESATRMAALAKQSVSEGGSSFSNLSRLIADIHLMSVQPLDASTKIKGG